MKGIGITYVYGPLTVFVMANVYKGTLPVAVAKWDSFSRCKAKSMYVEGTPFSKNQCRVPGFVVAQGPSISMDTACSSSLVTTQYVLTALRSGRSLQGLTAGVNFPMNWETTFMFGSAGMLSPEGRCKTLDAKADGYVRSEACLLLCLR